MDQETVQKINHINQEFYKLIAPHFDQTRNYPWPGWNKLVSLTENLLAKEDRKNLRILDVGCGNGRFGLFLREELPHNINIYYYGIDSNTYLLERAKENLGNARLIKVDILNFESESLFPEIIGKEHEKFDLIVLFGVLHHMPGFYNRVELLKKLKKLLKRKGYLIFSTWNFLDSSSLRGRVQKWRDVGLRGKVEENDYLLNWEKGAEAVRYAHHFTDQEVADLCSQASLEIEECYRSNQKGDQYNKYFVTGV